MQRKQAGPSWGSQSQGFPPSHPVSGDVDDDNNGDEGDDEENHLYDHYTMCSIIMTTTQQE